MRQDLILILCLGLLSAGVRTHAQNIDIGETEVGQLRQRAYSGYVSFRTDGGGLGFRHERQKSIIWERGWSTEISFHHDPKEKKSVSIFSNASHGFPYGKLNRVFQWRTDYGIVRTLNHKPYWGGVSIGGYASGGIVMGITWPVCLKIWEMDESGDIILHTEAYHPEKHNLNNIYDGDSPFRGMKQMKLHPGLHLHSGLRMDFSNNEAISLALDVGINADVYIIPIEIMAYQKPDRFLINGYVNIAFGRRLAR